MVKFGIYFFSKGKIMIPYGRQLIEDDDIAEVIATLKSDFLTQGPKIAEFEKEICNYTGAKYCVAVANGTAALHLAVAALALPGDCEGITSPITFTASSNSMAYCGIKPVFADIDPNTYNILPSAIRSKITLKTRLIIPVHFAGQPADMDEISNIAKNYGLKVIEDAAHAIGSKYSDGSFVGNCRYSDMTIFSFHPVKTITTGEGGAITTNDPILYQKIMLLRSHGITKDVKFLIQNPGPWYYEMHELGFNYRMTDIQAALGISQLKKIDRFCKRRREIVSLYNKAFEKTAPIIQIPVERGSVRSCFHLYVVQIDFEKIGITRDVFMKKLTEKGVGTQVHYIPVHTQPWYRKNFGYKNGDLPIAEKYYEKALSLPLYPAMSDDDVYFVIKSIMELL
jgi:UDP-4-amino-4,6-dideoxy-N-acetyl-beta-L-altrosamine transaminase